MIAVVGNLESHYTVIGFQTDVILNINATKSSVYYYERYISLTYTIVVGTVFGGVSRLDLSLSKTLMLKYFNLSF